MRCAILAAVVSLTPLAAAEEKSANFVLDPEHTHVAWSVERFGFAKTLGSFASVQGELTYDEDNPGASRVTATIDVMSLRSDLKEREDIVRGGYWLNASEHADIYFVSTSVEPVEDAKCPSGCLLVEGQMTLKGVTRPLTLEVRLNKSGTDPVTRSKALGFSATGRFQRSHFGITTALGTVGDEVTFRIETVALAR